MDEKKHITELPAEKFHQNTSLFHGPTVKIYVGSERAKFEVSKALFCDASTFFDRAFSGSFKEGIEQEMYIVEDNPSTFGALVQYVYTGRILCEEGFEPDKEITFYLEFFLLADKVGLQSTPPLPVERLKALLYDIDNLRVLHYKLAYQLPVGHQVRIMMLQRAVQPYCNDMYEFEGSSYLVQRKFRVEDVYDEVEGFAADLLGAVATAFRLGRREGDVWYKDSFTGDQLRASSFIIPGTLF